MVDRLSRARRSWLMSRVRGKDTAPELRVRKLAHALGLRFRIHRSDLPGKPDLTFPGRRIVVFVHGCYWHRHPNCRKATPPSSEFWESKFESNVTRDARVTNELRSLGWKVCVIWECQTKKPDVLKRIVVRRIKGRERRPHAASTRRK